MKTLKITLALAFVLLLAPAITSAQEGTATLDFPNANKALQVVQDYTRALQAGDVAAMNNQLAPNAMIYGLGGGLDSLTVTQHKNYYTESTNKYSHSLTGELYLPVKVTDNWNEGEWVLAWGTNTITDKATGKTITIPYHTASMVDNGKIT
ncbi:nuclear transport factor 2 family protein [Antarcticibacterium flavum]|uniref:Nuclear transport factor 2 family protein n=1 Tax=Antarcticibacterium flavum TaxID=2058175 RepID=A0A5B7X3X8_9FLAO|nr:MULTISPECIES: nuclear transport factor 2 family protein [Antarcticibacterium]MCM4161368.1 hypothetical protein [Antarcticibacterium sp. W02-3]QCY69442.1 nuclear transport factor 2 family protein [Antarcticibacterium flavum]